MIHKEVLKTCSRGHTFYKSSSCPICPICWSGYYKKKLINDFPDTLAAPALRALINAKITKLDQLTKYTKKEVQSLHGIGPNALNQLQKALHSKNIDFKK